MSDLLPCPFCGAPASKGHFVRDGFAMGCLNADCGCSMTAFNPDARSRARDRWNRRPQTSGDLVERLRELAAMEPGEAGQYQYDHSTEKHIATLAADALSRAPQPDTVTEKKITVALEAFDTGIGDPNDYRKRMRAALTAAIAVKNSPEPDYVLAGKGGLK